MYVYTCIHVCVSIKRGTYLHGKLEPYCAIACPKRDPEQIDSLPLGLQIAQSRSYVCTAGPKWALFVYFRPQSR